MKIEIIENGLLIVPETEFEIDYLRQFHDEKLLNAFLKHGVSIDDLIGLKIVSANKEPYTIKEIEAKIEDLNHLKDRIEMVKISKSTTNQGEQK